MVFEGSMTIVMAALLFVIALTSSRLLGTLPVFQFGGILLSLLFIGLLVSGSIYFVLAHGLWNGRRWAWTWTLISSIVSLIASVASMGIGILLFHLMGIGIVGIVIQVIIIYYLTRTQVKSYFK
jgi:uncharacterized membrane protein (DUF2068 family)